jgi:hypothetical protein
MIQRITRAVTARTLTRSPGERRDLAADVGLGGREGFPIECNRRARPIRGTYTSQKLLAKVRRGDWSYWLEPGT